MVDLAKQRAMPSTSMERESEWMPSAVWVARVNRPYDAQPMCSLRSSGRPHMHDQSEAPVDRRRGCSSSLLARVRMFDLLLEEQAFPSNSPMPLVDGRSSTVKRGCLRRSGLHRYELVPGGWAQVLHLVSLSDLGQCGTPSANTRADEGVNRCQQAACEP